MSAGHAHSPGHDHAGGTAGNRRRLALVRALTVSVLVVQVVGAALSGSLAVQRRHAQFEVHGGLHSVVRLRPGCVIRWAFGDEGREFSVGLMCR